MKKPEKRSEIKTKKTDTKRRLLEFTALGRIPRDLKLYGAARQERKVKVISSVVFEVPCLSSSSSRVPRRVQGKRVLPWGGNSDER